MTWAFLKNLIPSKELGIALAVVALFGAGVWSGWNWKAAKVARDRADNLQASIDLAQTRLETLATQHREDTRQINEVRNVTARAVIEIDPIECALTDESYGMFLDTYQAADSLIGEAPGVLPAVSKPAPEAPERPEGIGDIR